MEKKDMPLPVRFPHEVTLSGLPALTCLDAMIAMGEAFSRVRHEYSMDLSDLYDARKVLWNLLVERIHGR